MISGIDPSCVVIVTAEWRVVLAATRTFGPDAVLIEPRAEPGLSQVRSGLARAAIFDVDVGDDVIDVVASARRVRQRLPILVLSSHPSTELVNRAFALGASLLCKPCTAEDFATFGRRAFVSRFAVDELRQRALETFCERAALSPAQAEIIAAAYAGFSPSETSALVGRRESSVRAGLGAALKEAGQSSIAEATAEIDALVRQATHGRA